MRFLAAALVTTLLATHAVGAATPMATRAAACLETVCRGGATGAAAASELTQLGAAGCAKLCEGLTAGGSAPALCAWVLSQHPESAAREPLEALLLGADQVAAYWAAKALGALGDQRSVPALAKLLADEKDAYWELAQGPNRMFAQKVIEGKRQQVFAPKWVPNLRAAYAAMLALGDLGGAQAQEVLRAALRDSQYLIRQAAVTALGSAGETSDRALLATVAAQDPVLIVRQAAVRALGGLGGQNLSPPTRDAPLPAAVIFVKSTHRTESNLGFRDSYFFPKTPWYAWGENLYRLCPVTPDGTLTNLTNLENGAVQGPEVSFDGKRVLFAMRRDFNTDGFHLYEMGVDGSGLRQLTSGNCNDVDPCYLPDGRIMFCSDRPGYREYYHQERSRCLYVMEGDGSGIEQVSFNPNQDYEPLVLRDGRVLYGSYRFYAQDGSPGPLPGEHFLQRIETVLRTIDPEGANDQLFYGSMRGSFYAPLRPLPDSLQYQGWHPRGNHVGVSISQAREMPDGRILCVSPAGLTLLDPELPPTDCEAPLFPEILNLAGGEETYIYSHDEFNPVGRFTSPFPLNDQWALVSHAPWYDLRREAYDVYLMDLGTRELKVLYRDPEFAVVDALPVAPRPVPRRIPRKPTLRARPTGFVYCNSVFSSDVPYDHARAKYVQVLESLLLPLSLNANGNFRTRILGTVPLQPDGSFYVEVPADTPFRFQLLDDREQIVVHETAFNYVRGGEQKGCLGCHEPKDAPPLNAEPEALRHPPYRTFQRGRLIYQGAPSKPTNLAVHP